MANLSSPLSGCLVERPAAATRGERENRGRGSTHKKTKTVFFLRGVLPLLSPSAFPPTKCLESWHPLRSACWRAWPWYVEYENEKSKKKQKRNLESRISLANCQETGDFARAEASFPARIPLFFASRGWQRLSVFERRSERRSRCPSWHLPLLGKREKCIEARRANGGRGFDCTNFHSASLARHLICAERGFCFCNIASFCKTQDSRKAAEKKKKRRAKGDFAEEGVTRSSMATASPFFLAPALSPTLSLPLALSPSLARSLLVLLALAAAHPMTPTPRRGSSGGARTIFSPRSRRN